MTDPSNLARLVRDPSTGEMEWLRPSTDTLDLATLPDRLDDETLERVEAISRSPLPALPSSDSRHLAQALRMMLAVLPRRQADDVSGELFVAAYERQLGHYSNDAITHLCDQSIRTCKWFPTVAECLEILSTWRRYDEHTQRQTEATRRAREERDARRRDRNTECLITEQPWGFEFTQEFIDGLSPKMIKIGIACGALVETADGKVVKAEPEPGEDGLVW